MELSALIFVSFAGASRRWRWTIRAAGGRTVKSGIAIGESDAAEGAAECVMADLLAIELD